MTVVCLLAIGCCCTFDGCCLLLLDVRFALMNDCCSLVLLVVRHWLLLLSFVVGCYVVLFAGYWCLFGVRCLL